MDGTRTQTEIHDVTSVNQGQFPQHNGRQSCTRPSCWSMTRRSRSWQFPSFQTFLRAMQKQSEEKILEVLVEIGNWIPCAAAHGPVKTLLEAALPDAKSRAAYQMLNGQASMEQVRIACKMSPNALVALANRCAAMGLMELNEDKKRVRLFDLTDFGLIEESAGNSA